MNTANREDAMQDVIVRRPGRVGVFSWTDGFKEAPAPTPDFRNPEHAQAHALWLENHGFSEAALAFLDWWDVTYGKRKRCGAV